MYSGPTPFAPTYYANFLSGFIIVLYVIVDAQSCQTLCDPWTVDCQVCLSREFSRQEKWSGGTESGSPALRADSLTSDSPGSHYFTLIFSYSTTNSKQILTCHSCQMVPSSTILRPRQKWSLPWALHFREPILHHCPGTSWSKKSVESKECFLTSLTVPQQIAKILNCQAKNPGVSSPGQRHRHTQGVVKRQSARGKAMLLWEWAHGHAMAKNLEYREKEGEYRIKMRWQRPILLWPHMFHYVKNPKILKAHYKAVSVKLEP